jgi:hypothetical protein
LTNKNFGELLQERSKIVIGTIETIELFQDLLVLIEKEIGPIRSHFFRHHQSCGFVYFHDEPTATKAIEFLDGHNLGGVTLKGKL